jgi:hypothetical protein
MIEKADRALRCRHGVTTRNLLALRAAENPTEVSLSEQTFNPDAKQHHWSKRKLKRDQ